MSGSRADREVNANQNGRSCVRRQGQHPKDEDTLDTHKLVEDSLQEELMHARQAGGDVDRLVMKALLARVRESGPNSAFKALLSIEVRGIFCPLTCFYPSHVAIVAPPIGPQNGEKGDTER